MFIDPRVARGRARFDLARNAKLHPEKMHRELVSLVKREAERRVTLISGRRARMRSLKRDVAPRVRALGHDPYVGELDGHHGLFLVYLSHDALKGVVGHYLRYDVDSSLIETFVTTRVETHALARCMQRLGRETLAQIESEILAVFATAEHFCGMAAREGWAQVGVPTPGGIFVGAVDETNLLRLHTFLRPGDNGRESRWTDYRALFDGIPDYESKAGIPGEALLRRCIAILDETAADQRIVERFPFLAEPYERREDPQDKLWAAARAAAQQQENDITLAEAA